MIGEEQRELRTKSMSHLLLPIEIERVEYQVVKQSEEVTGKKRNLN